MSHANGEIWSQEGNLLGFFEYNGTCDCVCTRVHQTEEGVIENWRGDNWRNCTCGGSGQPAILYTNYGFGYHWIGAVCWVCNAVVGGISDFDSTPGHPFFDERMIVNYGRILPCPKCGRLELKADGGKSPIGCSNCGERFHEWHIQPKEGASA